MAIETLYRETVLAHNRSPNRFGALAHATHAACGNRPSCGDALTVQLRVRSDRIEDYGFSGEGCAVAIATASMLGDLLVGAHTARLSALRADFEAMLTGGDAAPALGELAALAGLHAHPARQPCALLAFDAAREALTGREVGK